jgi:hypothetical protein
MMNRREMLAGVLDFLGLRLLVRNIPAKPIAGATGFASVMSLANQLKAEYANLVARQHGNRT